ncbi:MAG TPA: HEAT repeat domain-containing protein, partial [Thermoanaerobaculia bacterium]|nr:HEAT repeat domain-containing protein [Thermoanaerobaculia bacterium]
MTAESLIFALLQILTRPEEDDPVVLREGEILWGDRQFPLASGAPAPAKTAYLLQRIGLEGVPLERLAETWSSLLAEEHPRTARELLAAVRRPDGSPAEEDAIPRSWRAAVEPLLRQIPAPDGAAESFGPETPAGDFAPRPELRPLLETWPRRLLHHPWWTTAEAPLPTMSPLPLDQVWVDLQMLEPGEWPVLSGLESLRGLLDQRYEERRWLSEPLALVLERLDGVAAFIGPPGSGKTTLLKWIARRLIQEPGSRYLVPLFVPLRRYVLWRMDGGEPGLLRFALGECGVQEAEQKSLWVRFLSGMAGTWRERILVLLDGWDEVPVEQREPLLRELQDLSYGFSVVVTSRPAAFPARLAASRVYEVADLAPDGIDALIRRWFGSTGDLAQAEALLRHLEQHPDLRRLARNPFLLTLLCGISREARRRQGLDLPTTRAALYERALELIYSHHNERYPQAPLGAGRQRQIERLALWLLDEAPGAPRFVFGPRDVTDSGGDPDLLAQALQPARLLGQLGPDDGTYHFLHATFQEYLAAEALGRQPSEQAVRRLRAHVHDSAWQEVFHFLAARPGPFRDALWREMSAQAARPDRFGLTLVRIARWLEAAGARDGGVALLGRDLRDLLWPRIEQITASRIWVEAYVDLDAAGFVRRVEEAIRKADPRLRARLQRALTRVRNPAASRALVDQILSDDPHQAAVAATQLRLRIDRDGLARLRQAAGDSQRGVDVRRQAIQALGYARASTFVPPLLRIAATEPDLAAEVACALGRIGGQDATTGLVAMLERSEGGLQRSIVRALGDMRNAPARDALLDEIARRPEDDPLLVHILDALAEIPIYRGAELIVDLLASESPDIRHAATWALAEATGAGVFDGLVQAAEDPEEEVRSAALEVFQNHARPDDAGWLAACLADPARSADEKSFALRALLTTTGRYAGTPEGQWLLAIAVEQTLLALRDPEGD